MPLTIEIEEPLATVLRKTATNRRITADQLAKKLLGEALKDAGNEDEWSTLNRRRIELIRQSSERQLSTEETAELRELQDAADRRLDERDSELLSELERFRAKVEQIPLDESSVS